MVTSLGVKIKNMEELSKLYAISPKVDCPHIAKDDVQNSIEFLTNSNTICFPCQSCNETKENWLCLKCNSIYCSRFTNQHMLKHNQISNHEVALSFSDASLWCYICESYIYNEQVSELSKLVGKMKYPEIYR